MSRPRTRAIARIQASLPAAVGWGCVVLSLVGAAPLAWAVDPLPFLRKHCADCHGATDPAGGLDLQQLTADWQQPEGFAVWERLHDRVARGEMPPSTASQPPSRERDEWLSHLARELAETHRREKGTVLRRLNRQEYQNTLNDIFGTNLKLADRLPEDGRAHEFTNVGAALSISPVQMQRSLECVQLVLDDAIQKSIAAPVSQVLRASYADTRGGEQWLGKIWLKRDDGAVVFFKQYGYPGGMLREANVARDGWYNIRVTGYAHQSEQPITFSLGATTFAQGVERPTFGYFAFPPGPPTTITVRAWIPARYMIDILPFGITDLNNEIRQKGVMDYRGPGLAIQHVEIEGPLTAEFPSRGHQLIFAGLPRQEVLPRNPADRLRTNYQPRYELPVTNVRGELTPVLQRVAEQAFRRPVQETELESYLKLLEAQLEAGATNEEALRTAVTAIFCSPDFLYLRESAGQLTDHQLATRLSYFLQRTTPDATLRELADQRALTADPQALVQQTSRLLAHPHFERFLVDFTDAWLNLREIEFTNPDSLLFPEFDGYLQWSMLQETRGFLRTLIRENRPVAELVKADFALLNERLAEHYGIEGVQGPELRRVTLTSGHVRGGLLSQASVLKVSANGTNTSPVVRGVWVMERLLGHVPQPPPPGIPGVEPDIRGASTLRELLDKHRNLESCQGCHREIDPPGFALESFDPIGGWRDRFRIVSGGERVNREVRGQRVRYQSGPPVDASGELLDGRRFTGFVEFRELLANDEELLARNWVTKLLTFATGRELGFSDREEIERIVQSQRGSRYGMRDLLLAAVRSDIFRRR